MTPRLKRWSIGLAVVAMAAVFVLYRSYRTDPQGFESASTQLIHIAAHVASRIGFGNGALWRHYTDSRMRDLQKAADSGRVVKKLTFSRQEPADYGGVASFLWQWAWTNRVKVIFTSGNSKSLDVYVSASDADQVERYLNALTPASLNPFE